MRVGAAQLAACGHDVISLALPDNGCEMVLKKDFLELEDPFEGGRGHIRAGKRIQGDKVDLGPKP